MPEIEFSTHAKEMLIERRILEAWVWRTINTPDKNGWAAMAICITQKR